MKKILLIGTGGTIASRPSEDGLYPALTSTDLVNTVPEVFRFCTIDCIQVLNMDSTNIRPGDWLSISAAIRDSYLNYDAFVITHGTDTMAYTAAGLSYLIQDSMKPIVLTGAQLPITDDNSDAGRNLIDAFLCAADDKSHGVLLVFSGSVIVGTRARKNYTQQFAAFRSMNYPEVAKVQSGKVIWYIPQLPQRPVKFYDRLDSNVGLLKLVPGMDEMVLRFILDHYDGIIVESFGVGGLPEYSDFYAVIQEAVDKGKLIVMTTQVAYDGSHLDVYHVGHRIKSQLKVLEAYDMTSEAAVAKTMWILGQTRDFQKAEELFYQSISNDLMI